MNVIYHVVILVNEEKYHLVKLIPTYDKKSRQTKNRLGLPQSYEGHCLKVTSDSTVKCWTPKGKGKSGTLPPPTSDQYYRRGAGQFNNARKRNQGHTDQTERGKTVSILSWHDLKMYKTFWNMLELISELSNVTQFKINIQK